VLCTRGIGDNSRATIRREREREREREHWLFIFLFIRKDDPLGSFEMLLVFLLYRHFLIIASTFNCALASAIDQQFLSHFFALPFIRTMKIGGYYAFNNQYDLMIRLEANQDNISVLKRQSLQPCSLT
jgi:hypothetical protein